MASLMAEAEQVLAVSRSGGSLVVCIPQYARSWGQHWAPLMRLHYLLGYLLCGINKYSLLSTQFLLSLKPSSQGGRGGVGEGIQERGI